MRQLPLPFEQQPSYAAEDFFSHAGNALAQSWLDKPTHWTNGRLILWGETGCGKTHLLHVWAQHHQAKILYGPQLRDFTESPDGPLVVDDADLAADEAALLHLLNIASEAGQPVLMTTRLPPARRTISLPDLASRQRASLAVEVRMPDDDALVQLLGRMTAARQLVLDFHIQNLLLSYLPRTPAVLSEAIIRLDRASLANGGKITRALVLDLVNNMGINA